MAPVYIVQTGRGLQHYLLAVHLLAALAILLADLPDYGQWLLGGLLAVSLYRTWPAPREWRMRMHQEAGMQLWWEDEWRAVELLADSSVQTWWMVLNWRWPDARAGHTILILPGMLSPEDARRLRRHVHQVLSAQGKQQPSR